MRLDTYDYTMLAACRATCTDFVGEDGRQLCTEPTSSTAVATILSMGGRRARQHCAEHLIHATVLTNSHKQATISSLASKPCKATLRLPQSLSRRHGIHARQVDGAHCSSGACLCNGISPSWQSLSSSLQRNRHVPDERCCYFSILRDK